jgi:hypothetical protein
VHYGRFVFEVLILTKVKVAEDHHHPQFIGRI